MEDIQRQIRIATAVIAVIIPIGIIGFMSIEGMSILDATYTTIITLSTVGYGDFAPTSVEGKVFTLILVMFGLGAFAYAGQASIQVLTNPAIRKSRIRRKTEHRIQNMRGHYIICGMGEIVTRTMDYLHATALTRRDSIRQQKMNQIDKRLSNVLGKRPFPSRGLIRTVWLRVAELVNSDATLLDAIVVITSDAQYANDLRNRGLLVLNGDPSDNDMLMIAGIDRAKAMMVLLEEDTETLLTVLTAHNLAPTLHITAAVLDDELSYKMARVGAISVITPYDTAGRILNSATLRPAVHDFFHGLLFEHNNHNQITQLELHDNSPWINKTIGELNLPQRFGAATLGIRYADAHYGYAPPQGHRLQEDETLIVVAPALQIEHMQRACQGDKTLGTNLALWHPIHMGTEPVYSTQTYTLAEASDAITTLNKHFIVVAEDHTSRAAVEYLDPERPFVIISADEDYVSRLLARGFRVVHGSATQESTLHKAGIQRAQAIMVALNSPTDSVLTVLNSRILNKRLLITTTANHDEMISKLMRAGADRVVSPFHIAGLFVLLATIRPYLHDFVNYILFNYRTGLETTEIYMEGESIWIGKSIGELQLESKYNAGIIGIRQADRESYVYAPLPETIIREHEVLIIVTPMEHSDEIRKQAHGGTQHRPSTLRNNVLQSTKWTPDEIRQMLQQARETRSGQGSK